MSNVQKILNITEKQDEKIESIAREIADYEKELSFLRIKNESNPGKKLLWQVLEVIGWIITSVNAIVMLAFTSDTGDSSGFLFLLIFAGIPCLLSLMFKHFKSMYKVKEESLKELEDKISCLKRELEKFNEEKRNVINLASNEEILNINQNFNDEKECPMCAEMVKVKAKICRFCGYTFNQDDSV